MFKNKKLKIIYLINHAAFFASHRIDLFEYTLKKLNAEAYLIIGQPGSIKMEKEATKTLNKKKIKFYRTSFVNSNGSILKDIFGFFEICKLVYNIKPDIIHSASPKANFLAGLVSIFLNPKLLITSISGMGYLYTSRKLSFAEFISKLIFQIYLYILTKKKNVFFILQNKYDYNLFKKKFGKKKTILIQSSGINLKKFKLRIRKKEKIVVMPSRILYDKGVVEFVKAASTLKKIYKDWRFKLIGTKDYNNPSMVPREIMQKWVKDKVIEIDEYTSDVNKLYEEASIVCLPSHREGFSKVILEAGAASLPIIASDIPGCKEGIINKKTGFLFKLKNHKDLILKFKQLIDDKKLRDKIGKNAYKHVTSNYDVDMINKKIIKLYKKVYE